MLLPLAVRLNPATRRTVRASAGGSNLVMEAAIRFLRFPTICQYLFAEVSGNQGHPLVR